MRSLVFGFIVLVLTPFLGCRKEYNGNESVLHGTWVKGSNFGDTLWFMKKNGQHIVRMPGFGPVLPNYSEKQYRLREGVLSIRLYGPSSPEYVPINSFMWTDPGKEFTILNVQLFSFMSSIVTYQYKKT